jgi:hypothetical protein
VLAKIWWPERDLNPAASLFRRDRNITCSNLPGRGRLRNPY